MTSFQRVCAMLAAIVLAVATLATPNGAAAASQLLEAPGTLTPAVPTAIAASPVPATVNFGTTFASIDHLCFFFTFSGDLLDPGDRLAFTGPSGLNGTGFGNGTGSSQSERGLCFNPFDHPETIALFLDGQENFGLRMEAGTLTVSSLRVQITGVPQPKRDVTVKKTVSPSGDLHRGDTVTFTITFTLGSTHADVVIEDIFSGAGKVPDTGIVGSATLTGTPTAPSSPNPVPVLVTNGTNWVQYNFNLGILPAGTYTLTYQWHISDKLGCYTQAANATNVNVAVISGHVAQSRVPFQIRC